MKLSFILRRAFAIWIAARASLALFACLLTGCRASAPPTLAFIPQITADDLWESSHVGALEAVQGSRYHLYWNGPADDNDVQRQISLLDTVIFRRYQGIILAPVRSLALMVPVEKALDRGIPVAVVGTPLPLRPGGKLFYVLNDEEAGGRLAADRMGQKLHGRGQIAILGIDPEDTGMIGRVRAFDTTLFQRFPEIRIVATRADSQSEAQAEQLTEDTLRAYPKLTAIFALTPTMTVASFEALQQSGRGRHVMLMGCGQRYQLLYYLSEGWLDSLLADNTYQIGREAANSLIGENEGRHSLSVQFVEPVLVTRHDMYDPALIPVLTHLGKE